MNRSTLPLLLLVLVAAPLPAQSAGAQASTAPTATRLDAVASIQPRLDHFMWFVHDLPASRALLADTLGFTVSQGGTLDWGAENHLVHFENGSYLEPLLLRTPESSEFWGPFVRKHQGGAHFGLRVPSVQAAHDYFAARGLRVTAPYAATFERMGALTEMPGEMWRIVSNAGGGFLGDLIFWIEYTEAWDALHRRHPEIDRRRGTTHANTARRVASYHIASYNADRMAELFERLGLAVGPNVELPHLDAIGREVAVEGGSLWILTPRLVRSPVFAFLRERGEGVMGAAVEVADLEAARTLIARRSGLALEPYDTPAGRAFAVPADRARGVRLEFVQAR